MSSKTTPDKSTSSTEATSNADARPSDSKAALIWAARKVFSERGFEGATVKDLADVAGVNVSLVSYHFGGKDGLYTACITAFAEERVETMVRILKAPASRDELRLRLQMFAEEMVEVHLRDPETCRIIHRDITMMLPAVEKIFRNFFFRIFLTFVDFLKSANDAGVTRPLQSPENQTMLVLGSLMHFLNTENQRVALGRQSIRDPEFRKAFLNDWLEFAISGLSAPDSKLKEQKE